MLRTSPALRWGKSLQSFNPIPRGCVLYAPLWAPGLSGPVFKSVDAYGHTCTVTGALWTPDGRLFDEVDDKLSIPHATSIDNVFTGGGTLVAWINPASDGGNNQAHIAIKASGWFWNIQSEAAGYTKSRLYIWRVGDDGYWDLVDAVIPLNSWSHFAITYDADLVANNPIFYFNGAVTANTEGQAPTDVMGDDSGDDLYIGNRADGLRSWDNLIGEFWGYNRILSVSEINAIRNATKWRYQ